MSATPQDETVKEVTAVDAVDTKVEVDNVNDDQQTVQSTTAPDADTLIVEKETPRERANQYRRSIMDGLTLPPPPAFDLLITNLSIGIPRPARYLPLPVPIPIPSFLSRKKDLEYLKQTIIRDVNTRCGSGEVLAIIGGSGSGKSTLLSAIVGRLANLPVRSGELSFTPTSLSTANFRTLSARQMKDKIGFVPQNDYLLPNLTVRETLHYAASLRLPASIDRATRTTIVNQTLEELGLTDVADTVIGGFGGLRKGISGGERRRVSIACILVALPSVIVLDEPTSGLDAYTAYQILVTLSELAKRGRTIVLSLHQPRSDAFALFTRMLVLSKGSVVYSGLTSKCLPWFAAQGYEPDVGVNPLDFLIDISSVEMGDEEKVEASKARVQRLVNAWKEDGPAYGAETSARWSRRVSKDVQSDEKHILSGAASQALKNFFHMTEEDRALRRPGLLSQTITLTSRANKNTLRNHGQTVGYMAQSVVIGLMLGGSYYNLQGNPTDIQSLKTLCFQHMAAYFYLTIVYAIYRYCNELVVFDRERADHLYKVVPWIFSEVIANLSINVIFPALFAVIVYFMTNLRTDNLASNLFILIAECILVQLGSISFALVSASMVRVFASASLMANGISIFFFLSAGYAILKPPVYVDWIKYISIFYYGFRIAAISQFKGRVFSCEGVTGLIRNQCLGDQVLTGLRIPIDDPLWKNFVPLTGLVIGFNSLAGVLLALWKPGGVQHAAKVSSSSGKETLPESDMDIIRQKVDVEVKGLGLSWVRPGHLFFKHQQKRILDNVTFSCPAGQITAIMGPSGAGKSSILQLLAARQMNAGQFAHFQNEGTILFNGKPLSRDDSDTVSFVEQEDEYHLPALTVRETIRYAAILRLPRTMSRRSKLARAEEVLRMLGLEDCADNLVGGQVLKGISGGEKRRLSLAVEMLNDPAVLIVDEVTSGLDAATANNVMQGLKSIADSGRTIILTLHQPRSDIYQLLDNVVVLAKGGRMVYAGPRKQVEGVFNAQGFSIPEFFNPADFLLDVISIDHRPEHEKETRDRVDRLVAYWAQSERQKAGEPKRIEPTPLIRKESRLTPMWIAAPILLERNFRNMWRQQPVFWVRIQQTPLMGALFLLYFQRLSKGPTGGQDRIGFIQQILGAIPYIGLLNSVAIFPVERDLFFHEYNSSAAYSTATLTLVTTLIEAPFTFVANLLLGLLANLLAGLSTSPRIYFQFVASTFAVQSLGESVGIIFAAFTPSMGLSVSLVSTVLSIMIQFSGLVSLSVPKWLQAIAWATTFKPAARIMIINEASKLHLNCPPETIESGQCLIQDGQDLIALFGWKDLDTAKFVGIMVACCVAWRLLAWVALMIKMRGW